MKTYEVKTSEQLWAELSAPSAREVHEAAERLLDQLYPPDPPPLPPCSCGAPMVERTNRQTQERFLGCSTWPKCHNTKRG